MSTVVTPSPRSSSSSAHVSRRACGSIPAVGSSTKSSSGRPITRHREGEPLLLAAREPAVRRPPAVLEPEPLDEHRDGQRVRVQRRDVVEHLLGPGAGPGAAGLEHHADAGEQRPPVRAAGRARGRGPCPAGAGGTPRRSRAWWSCPAPFGPRTAVIEPRSTVRSRPSTATLSPYAIRSPCTSTAGAEAAGHALESRSRPPAGASRRPCRVDASPETGVNSAASGKEASTRQVRVPYLNRRKQ